MVWDTLGNVILPGILWMPLYKQEPKLPGCHPHFHHSDAKSKNELGLLNQEAVSSLLLVPLLLRFHSSEQTSFVLILCLASALANPAALGAGITHRCGILGSSIPACRVQLEAFQILMPALL